MLEPQWNSTEMSMTLPTIVSFWHGPLIWLEVLCITSFQQQGHHVAVYSYDPIANLPSGAEWRDASEILPMEKLVFYKGRGTPAVFSDRFRLELLRRGLGIYADLDIYCVRPILAGDGYVMGLETPDSINNAVLLIPPDAPLLSDLLAIFDPKKRDIWLPFLPPLRRLEVAVRRLAGETLPVEHMQFGATGPMPLTYYARKHGLYDKASAPDVFYPVPYKDIPTLMQPGSSFDRAITANTLGIHLWRSQFTDRGRASIGLPQPGSALAKLCARDGLDPAAV